MTGPMTGPVPDRGPAGCTVLPYGRCAWLVEFDADPAVLRGLRQRFVDATRADVRTADALDVVPAARTVLVRWADETRATAAAAAVRELADAVVARAGGSAADAVAADDGATHPDDESAHGVAETSRLDADGEDADHAADGELVIPVTYDGEDLADVAAQLGCAPEEVRRRHQAARWVVEFAGFAPGFGYLTQVGEPEQLTVTRRDSPRTSIPAGAVALAGDYAGVYPSASPGGWQFIGRTDLRMFDPTRQPAALLTPGRRVRFVDAESDGDDGADVAGRAHTHDVHDDTNPTGAPSGSPSTSAQGKSDDWGGLVVERAGPQVLVEDIGRLGHLDVGLTASGACDRAALRLANWLVGNDEGTAALEVLFGGLVVRAERPCVVAVIGAPVTLTRESGMNGVEAPEARDVTQPRGRRAVEFATPILLDAGDRLALGMAFDGLRSYVAVAGGIVADRVEGSASSDPRNGIGAPPLRAGARVVIGSPRSGQPACPDHLAPASVLPPGPLVLRVTWGPRAEWFTSAAREAFASSSYHVTQDAERVGVRFDGPILARAQDGELASEAVIRGAVQVPADGRPLMFFADHPTTGGYPVIAVVDDADTDLLAQARPGQEVRFAVRPGCSGVVAVPPVGGVSS